MSVFNIGVIGCGDIAVRWHIPTMMKSSRVNIVGVSNRTAAKMEAVQARYHFKIGTTDYRDLLKNPDIDAVVVTTSPWATPGITIDALESGKHVLCEKPMALDVKEARRVEDAEKRTGYKVMVGFTYRNDPLLRQARKWIAEGRLGSPLIYRMAIYDEIWDPLGNPEQYRRIDETMQHGCPSVHDGAHTADFLNLLTGASPVKKVEAFGFKSRPEFSSSNYDISVIDFENGDRAKLEIAWFYPVFPYGEFEVVGPGGLIEYDRLKRYVRLRTREKTEEIRDEHDWWECCFDVQLDRFLDSIKCDMPCVPGVTEGIYSLELTERIKTVIQKGEE
jgi:predicted dehydrogenase